MNAGTASGWGRIRREMGHTAWLALPIIIGQVLSVAMNFIDTVLAGKLSTSVLAAVAMGYQVWVIALLIVIGLMLAITPTVAQLDGARRRSEVGSVFRQALWLALGVGVLLGWGLCQAKPLLVAAGVAPAVIPEAMGFLRSIAWAAPALALIFACKNMSEGMSLPRPTAYFGLLGVVLLLPTAYALMYGKWGFAAQGARGAGIAHALALWVQALCFLAYVWRRPHYREMRLFARFEWPKPRVLGELLRLGIPMGTALFMEGSLFVTVALLMGSLGETAAGAHAIAINVASITFMVPLGLSMATTVRVGNAVGRRDPTGILWAAGGGMLLMLLTQTVSAGLLIGLSGPIAGVYTHDAAVSALAVVLLRFAAWFQFSDGIQVLANGALRGLKDALAPALITIVAYWAIGFPMGWWLGIEKGFGAEGLWTGLIIALSAAALLLLVRFLLLSRRLFRGGIPEHLAREAVVHAEGPP